MLGQLRRMRDYSLLKQIRLEKLLRREELDRVREVKLGNSSYRGLIAVMFEFTMAKSVIECCYSYDPLKIYLQLLEFKG